MAVKFDGVNATPPISQPCLSALLRALDSSVTLTIRPSAMGVANEADVSSTAPVGSLFVDIILDVVTKLKLSDMTYLMARAWLEMLIIIILKARDVRHPFQSRPDVCHSMTSITLFSSILRQS